MSGRLMESEKRLSHAEGPCLGGTEVTAEVMMRVLSD